MDIAVSWESRWFSELDFPLEMWWPFEHSDSDLDDGRFYLWLFHSDCMGFEQFIQSWQLTAELSFQCWRSTAQCSALFSSCELIIRNLLLFFVWTNIQTMFFISLLIAMKTQSVTHALEIHIGMTRGWMVIKCSLANNVSKWRRLKFSQSLSKFQSNIILFV
jgi:hypothetical protein